MKTWEKPQLIVLVRSKPEETLLFGCKGIPTGPATAVAACSQTLLAFCIGDCSALLLS